MPPFFEHGLRACWLAVIGYWLWSARRVKAPKRTESLAKRFLAHWLPLIVAVLLLGPGEWFGHSLLREQFVPHTTLVYSIGLALCIAGAALAIWSRAILGANWSAQVQIKQGHELIERGPYALVRHPIYTAYLLAWAAGVVVTGRAWLLPTMLCMVPFYFVAARREEESFRASALGPRYEEYQRRTGMFVPNVVRVWAGLRAG